MRKIITLILQFVKPINYRNFLLICLVFISISLKSQNIGINVTGAAADKSAMLDVVSTTKGFLMPRVTDTTSVLAPASGLLIYRQTAPAGFFYHNGTTNTWVPLLTNSTANGGWALSGNANTTASTSAIGVAANNNYIGTNNNSALVIATTTGGVTYERARISNSGNVGIGNNSPAALLDIGTNGNTAVMRLEGNTSGYVGIQSNATAGNWTLTLPTSGGLNGYALTTDGTGITTWSSAGGGAISTVSGASPIVVAPSIGNVLVFIEDPSNSTGGVLYSQGSAVNAAYTAAGVAPFDSASQVLESQGAGTPTWNTIGGVNIIFYKGDSSVTESLYSLIRPSWTNWFFSSHYAKTSSTHNTDATEMTMPKCYLTRVRVVPVPLANGLTGTTTFTVYKNGSATTMTGTLAGTVASPFNFGAGNPIAFSDGDYFELGFTTTAGGTTLQLVNIELTYYPLP